MTGMNCQAVLEQVDRLVEEMFLSNVIQFMMASFVT